MHLPERDVGKAKEVLAYIEVVNNMNFPRSDRTRTPSVCSVQSWLSRECPSTLGVMQYLDLGMYTARRIVSMLTPSTDLPLRPDNTLLPSARRW